MLLKSLFQDRILKNEIKKKNVAETDLKPKGVSPYCAVQSENARR